jgi:hypothetical protein
MSDDEMKVLTLFDFHYQKAARENDEGRQITCHSPCLDFRYDSA